MALWHNSGYNLNITSSSFTATCLKTGHWNSSTPECNIGNDHNIHFNSCLPCIAAAKKFGQILLNFIEPEMYIHYITLIIFEQSIRRKEIMWNRNRKWKYNKENPRCFSIYFELGSLHHFLLNFLLSSYLNLVGRKSNLYIILLISQHSGNNLYPKIAT